MVLFAAWIAPPSSVIASAAAAAVFTIATLVAVRLWPSPPAAEAWLKHRQERRHSLVENRPTQLGARPRTWTIRAGEVVWGRLPAAATTRLDIVFKRVDDQPTATETLGVGSIGAAAVLALSGLAVTRGWISLPTAVAATLAVPALLALHLLRLAQGRRHALLMQLPLLVDLMALEQSAGGIGPRAAMEAAVSRVGGEASNLLHRCLTESAAAGTPSVDRQVEAAGVTWGLAELAALGAVLRLQREEGIATTGTLSRLARSLRDSHSERLVAKGKRTLVTMIFPVALCVLLPFLVILLYPALVRIGEVLG